MSSEQNRQTVDAAVEVKVSAASAYEPKTTIGKKINATTAPILAVSSTFTPCAGVHNSVSLDGVRGVQVTRRRDKYS